MKRLFWLAILLIAADLRATTFHVKTTGTAGGDGSVGNPWDLHTALDEPPGTVAPDDIINIHAGTYTGANGGGCNGASGTATYGYTVGLQGTSGHRITVQGAPGEAMPIIDIASCTMGLNFTTVPRAAAFVDIRDLRITKFSGSRCCPSVHGIEVLNGNDVRLINLVTDNIVNGSGLAMAPPLGSSNFEIYGLISFYNSNDNQNHGTYLRNPGNGFVKLLDSIVFNNCGLGTQAFPHVEDGQMNNPTVSGNISFNNGVLGPCVPHLDLLVGGSSVTHNPTLDSNLSFKSKGVGDYGTWIGYQTGCDGTITVTNNLLQSITTFTSCIGSATITGNTFYKSTSQTGTGVNTGFGANPVTPLAQVTPGFGANTYTDSAPGSAWILVRPNTYQAGRGNIGIVNWASLSSVDVNVSSILTAGHNWSLYTAWGFAQAASPVQTGTSFGGTTIPITMSGYSMPTPVGGASWPAPGSPGPKFMAFVLLDTGAGSTPTPSNTPTITSTPTITPTFTGTPPTPTATPTPIPGLGPVHWCVCPGVIFRCEHLPTTPTSHNDVCPATP